MIASSTYTVVGNLTAQPELRHTPNGTPVTRARIAFNPVTRKADGSLARHDAVFHDVQLWGPFAERFSELDKGTAVIVMGEFRTDNYRTRDGEPRSRTYLEASAGGPDLSRAAIAGITYPTRDHATSGPAAADEDDFDVASDLGL